MWISFLEGFWTAFSWASIGWCVGAFCLVIVVFIIALILEKLFS